MWRTMILALPKKSMAAEVRSFSKIQKIHGKFSKDPKEMRTIEVRRFLLGNPQVDPPNKSFPVTITKATKVFWPLKVVSKHHVKNINDEASPFAAAINSQSDQSQPKPPT